MLSPDEIHQELLERGCALQPGASSAEIANLEEVIGSALSPYAQGIYTRFNGFVENTADNLSHLSLWSIAEIIRFRRDMNAPSKIVVFGDRLIQSDFLSCDLSHLDARVTLLESREVLSQTYAEFWFKLLNSEYDLAQPQSS